MSTIEPIVHALDISVKVIDIKGMQILGQEREGQGEKYPIEVGGATIGWAIGEEKVAAIAKLLSTLVSKELEKKSLAQEALSKYRKITFLYKTATKLAANLDLKQVGTLVCKSDNAALTARSQAERLQQTLSELQETQVQLIQTEKMSALGQLIA